MSRVKANLLFMEVSRIINEIHRQRAVNKFRCIGFHDKIFDRVVRRCSSSTKNYAKCLMKKYKIHQLLTNIHIKDNRITTEFKLNCKPFEVYVTIKALPIRQCNDFISLFCESCGGVIQHHNVCEHLYILFHTIRDNAPTTNDLMPHPKCKYQEDKNVITFGKHVVFEKDFHNIYKDFSCKTILNDTNKSIQYFSKMNPTSECYMKIFLFYIGAVSIDAPICPSCVPVWDAKQMCWK
eukprot:313780_1